MSKEKVSVKGISKEIVGENVTDNTRKTLVYKENGVEIAEGEGIIDTVKSYYKRVIGEDFEKSNKWKEYPRNKDYEVSNLGFVRRKSSVKVLNMSLKDVYDEDLKGVWRLRVTIPKVGTMKVSQVVMETFKGLPKSEGLIIGHKNDVPLDNRAENLKYITRAENTAYASFWRDYDIQGLDKGFMELIYKDIKDYLEMLYGDDWESIGELTRSDKLEIQEGYITEKGTGLEVSVLTIGEIYKYFKVGEGLIKELEREGYIKLGGDKNE